MLHTGILNWFLYLWHRMKTREILIARPSNSSEANSLKAFLKALKIKFEVSGESPYDPTMVKKIEKGRKHYREGKGEVITVKDLEKLWK